MIRQVSDLYTQTAEATAKELEDASTLSEAGGENFKVERNQFECHAVTLTRIVCCTTTVAQAENCNLFTTTCSKLCACT